MISNQEKPEELIRAENLIDDGNYNNALEIMSIFEGKKGKKGKNKK